jgi:hypothetical protein
VNDVLREVGRTRECIRVCDEEDVAEEHATDQRVFPSTQPFLAVGADPFAQRAQTLDPVPLAEQAPGLTQLQLGVATQEAPADQLIARMVSLEEERLAGADRLELRRCRRLPEVHLGQVRACAQVGRP